MTPLLKLMKINKYYPFAFIYFFINIVGLPFGLLYTTILTPVFYVWLLIKGKRLIIFRFFLFATPFVIVHLFNGVDKFYYSRSLVVYLTVYIFCYAFHTLLTTYNKMEGLFKRLTDANFAFTIIALFLLVTPLKNLLWFDWSISVGGLAINNWPRLLMLTYEPSYYATLMVPLFVFYFIQFILKQSHNGSLQQFFFIGTPLLLSLSMGVIAGLVISIIIFILVNARRFLTSKTLLYSLIAISFFFLSSIVILFYFYPQNPISVRLIAIFAGADGSANGRTFEAFELGVVIAKLKSIWWGVGPGQLKIIGDPIIKAFYNYPPDYGQVSIPSTFSETIAIFGIIGGSLRMMLEFFFFFKTKVYNNYFRTLLFIYIFIYQFTGSFTTNIAEYVIWILAFTNTFPQFDRVTNKVHHLYPDEPIKIQPVLQ